MDSTNPLDAVTLGDNAARGVQPGKPPAAGQFSVASLLWVTATVGMVLSYLRAYEPNEWRFGLASVGLGLLVGVIAGAIFRRWGDAIFWSLLGAMSTFLCAAGYDLFHPSFRYGWMLVGAVAGAGTGITAPGRPLRTMLVGALGGAAVLGAFAAALPKFSIDALIEVAVAGIGGALLGGVVEAICWAESRHHVARYIVAACLLFAVIAGNVVGKSFIPGW